MTAEHSTASEKKAKLAAYQKAYREANREKQRAYMVSYYAANKGTMNAQAAANYRANATTYKARARKWEHDNIERKRELRAEYRDRSREKIKEFSRVDWLKHNAKRNARKREYRQERPDLSMHHVRLRQTRKQNATPVWADLDAIKAVYKDAAKLKKQTGMAFHVDHVIPLKHPLVCGLHVHTNLRVIPAADNQSKGNRLFE